MVQIGGACVRQVLQNNLIYLLCFCFSVSFRHCTTLVYPALILGLLASGDLTLAIRYA
jgi:hypothetical protein